MNIDELIQLIRTCNANQVRAELELLQRVKESNEYQGEKSISRYQIIYEFYQDAARRKK